MSDHNTTATDDKLQLFAEADRSDDKLIAEALQRKRQRQQERASLRKGDQEITDDLDSKTTFEELLTEFIDMYDYSNAAEHAFSCPKCHHEPEDPILTNCLHVYCTECFTIMLFEARVKPGISFVQCCAFDEDQITDCIELDVYCWEMLKLGINGMGLDMLQIIMNARTIPKSLHEKAGEDSVYRRPPVEQPGDIEKLWNSIDWAEEIGGDAELAMTGGSGSLEKMIEKDQNDDDDNYDDWFGDARSVDTKSDDDGIDDASIPSLSSGPSSPSPAPFTAATDETMEDADVDKGTEDANATEGMEID